MVGYDDILLRLSLLPQQPVHLDDQQLHSSATGEALPDPLHGNDCACPQLNFFRRTKRHLCERINGARKLRRVLQYVQLSKNLRNSGTRYKARIASFD